MSYSNPNVEIVYTNGDAVGGEYSVNFYYLEGEDSVIQVELWDYTDAQNPIQQSFVLNVDYTIDSSNYPNTVVIPTDPVPDDFKLIIYRSHDGTQASNFVNGAFPAESVEEAIDRATMNAQETKVSIGRALLNPIGGPYLTTQDVVDAVADASAVEARVTQAEDDIATNTVSISDNADAIALRALDTIVQMVTANHVASADEIVIVEGTDPVTVFIPNSPPTNTKITVKNNDTTVSRFITAVQNIDGFGNTYALESEYESVSLVFSGTQWYII